MTSPWRHVGLDNNFIVVWPHGHDDGMPGGGSWNCTSTNGPLGPPCDTDRAARGGTKCYPSCPNCDALNSCDWTSCADDVGFIHFVMEEVTSKWYVIWKPFSR